MSMKNGWTGGQYSLYRVIFGIYLFSHFLSLLPWGRELFSSRGVLPHAAESPFIHLFPNILAVSDGPKFVTCLLIAAIALSFFFAIGFWDRAASVGLWYLSACFLGRNPLIANPGLPYIGWLLLAHSFLPAAPYGSWAARKRSNPGGGWKMTPSIYLAAWILMALGYTYSGFMKLNSPSWIDGSAMARVLENPLARLGLLRTLLLSSPAILLRIGTWLALALELSFAPLALFRRARPWIWLGALFMHLGLFGLISFFDLTAGMVILHLFTFNPEWIKADTAVREEELFFDGHCGLCHRAVRFVLAEDTKAAFRFAPLQGETFGARLPVERPSNLPDSVVVLTDKGALLARSDAFVHILRRLGGGWTILAKILSAIPRGLRDLVYDFVARIRYRLFGRRDNLCPVVPPNLRARFDP
jgi:predicted DCC family thiol-disulfide oxidoreductase YuxK